MPLLCLRSGPFFFDLRIIDPGSQLFIKSLHVFRYMRLFRLVRILGRLCSFFEDLLWFDVEYLEIATALVGLCFWVHLVGCLWYRVGEMSGGYGWISVHEVDEGNLAEKYAFAVSFAISTLQGPADLGPSTILERAVCFAMVLTSILVLGLFTSKTVTVIMSITESSRVQTQFKRGVNQFMYSNTISKDLVTQVKQYIKQSEKRRRGALHTNPHLDSLPEDLRRELLEEARSHSLCHHVVFFALKQYRGRWFQRIACDAIHCALTFPGEPLFILGQTCTTMYFITEGKSVYYRHNSTLLHIVGICTLDTPRKRDAKLGAGRTILGAGDHVCEPVLWCPNWLHCGDLTVHFTTSSLNLDFGGFADVVKIYPHMAQRLLYHAVRFVIILNRYELSDMFDSNFCFGILENFLFRAGSKQVASRLEELEQDLP